MASTGAQKKKVLFDESDDDSDGGVDIKINDEYAKRFEHNKKREELHRLEEKYKSNQPNGNNKSKPQDEDDEDDSSSDETEDEDAYLATEELDAQISATLQALKTKDPRLYDGKTSFYTPIEEDAAVKPTDSKEKKEKPVYLQDYHRERLLRGETGADDEELPDAPPQTYAQEQDDLKKSLQNEIQAQLQAAGDDESSEDEGFIKSKADTKVASKNAVHPSRAAKIKVPLPDPKEADRDPELFLSNFLASRAWAKGDGNGWQPFESDDEEEELNKAEEWETAYNLRFEDPSKSNEVLRSYARDVTASISVRREEKTGRKRLRELEKERAEAEKQQRKEERARLRRLKVEEADKKLKMIKKAAGLRGKHLKDEEWQAILESAWEDDKFEEAMNKFFNDQYYAEGEGGSDDEDAGKSKKKVKKPEWDDDIDIKDIIPDFEDEERPKFSLSDEEAAEEAAEEEVEDDDEDGPSAKRQKTSKDRKKEKLASQKEARQERARLEALVEKKLNIENPEILNGTTSKKKGAPRFGYLETKPETFGLTTRDILMASDADLNEYVGLKKLAHWRDPEKQQKDKKRLGKKARLRQWRKETFGPEFEREPPALNFGKLEKEKAEEERGNVVEGGSKKKRKRSRPKKDGKGEEETSTAIAAAPVEE